MFFSSLHGDYAKINGIARDKKHGTGMLITLHLHEKTQAN